MSDNESKHYHLNQLLPDIVRFAFPELKQVDIIAEHADIDHSFTDNLFDNGTYTLRLGNELKDAPVPVRAGAIAMELQQIAKQVRTPLRYRLQRFWKWCSVDYQIKVSQREDIDLINREFGGCMSEFNDFIGKQCGYVWNPKDGYHPGVFEMYSVVRQETGGHLIFI